MQSIGAKYTVLVEQSGFGRHGGGGQTIRLNPRDSFGIRARNVFSNFEINKTTKIYQNLIFCQPFLANSRRTDGPM
jgi:hypothetical protein